PVRDQGPRPAGTDSPCVPDRRRRSWTASWKGLRAARCAAPVTSVRVLADGGSLSSVTSPGPAGALVEAPRLGDGRHGIYLEGREHLDARRREQPQQARAAGQGRKSPGEGREGPGRAG